MAGPLIDSLILIFGNVDFVEWMKEKLKLKKPAPRPISILVGKCDTGSFEMEELDLISHRDNFSFSLDLHGELFDISYCLCDSYFNIYFRFVLASISSFDSKYLFTLLTPVINNLQGKGGMLT